MSAAGSTVAHMSSESFPVAWQHLRGASAHMRTLVARWSDALDAEPARTHVSVGPDGNGEIAITFNWGEGEQEAMHAAFTSVLGELWSTLDSLVVEAFTAMTLQHRPRDPAASRFFPVADSREGFDALLEQGCLDGVLKMQYQLVRACQPFSAPSGDATVDRFHEAVVELLDWTNKVRDGSRIGVWATPLSPEVRTEAPRSVLRAEPASARAVVGPTVVGSFVVKGYRPQTAVAAMAGTHLDLGFDGFEPSSAEDTFGARLGRLVQTVRAFAVVFSSFTDEIPGARPVRGAHRLTPTWTDAGDDWSADALGALGASDIGLGIVTGGQRLRLIVSTPTGVFERVVPSASPLRPYAKRGEAAEVAIRDAAATWGLPDFVFTAPVERKGSGVREVADGLLIVGGRGIIVQAKAREGTPGDDEREGKWVRKVVSKATKQAAGTLRRVAAAAVPLEDGRGRQVTVDGNGVSWAAVVVLDHPAPPSGIEFAAADGKLGTVVLYRRDWEFLFTQLRSTYAVVEYLHRVAAEPSRLGEEPERYYELAAADERATPGVLDPSLVGLGIETSAPTLPSAPAGSDGDEAHELVRIILEDIATTPIGDAKQDDRRRVLASLDSLPVAHRTNLGTFLLDAFNKLTSVQEGTTRWAFRTFLSAGDRDQLSFGVASEFGEQTRDTFHYWLRLRHHERAERVGDAAGLITIGVLLTPRPDQYRRWDTTMAAIGGDSGLTSEDVARLRELWPTPQRH